MHARPIRSSLGPDPNGSAPVCTGPISRVRYIVSKCSVSYITRIVHKSSIFPVLFSEHFVLFFTTHCPKHISCTFFITVN